MVDNTLSLIEITARALCIADTDTQGENDWKAYAPLALVAIDTIRQHQQAPSQDGIINMIHRMGDADTRKDSGTVSDSRENASPVNKVWPDTLTIDCDLPQPSEISGNGDLPCPFCGSKDLRSGGDDKFVGVWCNNCGGQGPNHYQTGMDWNKRACKPVVEWGSIEFLVKKQIPRILCRMAEQATSLNEEDEDLADIYNALEESAKHLGIMRNALKSPMPVSIKEGANAIRDLSFASNITTEDYVEAAAKAWGLTYVD